MEIYLDNSATTRVCESAAAAAAQALTSCYANPSAVHSKGIDAKKTVDEARSSAAALLGAAPEEIFFSHSGTLANNTAVFGAAQVKKRLGNRIVTTAAEHPSVARCMDELENRGFEIIRLAPDNNGGFSPEELFNAVDEKTVLVSAMLVNNETGAVNPVELIKKAVTAKRSPALIHTDAIQAFGKMPVKPSKLGVDLLTASGHKIHAPKGVGLLYIKKGVKIKPYVFGGGQESGMFSGTEPVPAIAGFSAAIKETDIEKNLRDAKEKNLLLRELLAGIPEVSVNSPDGALPYILNISVGKIPSQVLINYLSSEEIYVSAGSACKKGHRSEVLSAMGLPPERIDSAIRISMSRYTSEEEIRVFVSALKKAVENIRQKL